MSLEEVSSILRSVDNIKHRCNINTTTPNMPLTATKPMAMLQAKVSPLLRLAAGR